ncbi:MAG: hypothetical protein K0R49_622, partial [Burkholderiales bacterium]|nr:hypothetical protein [Burkholderiales bacterium]
IYYKIMTQIKDVRLKGKIVWLLNI